MSKKVLIENSLFLNESDFQVRWLLSRPTILLASFKKDIARLNKMVENAKSMSELDRVIKIADTSIKNINKSKDEKLSINMIPVIEKKQKEKIISTYIKDLGEVKKKAESKKSEL